MALVFPLPTSSFFSDQRLGSGPVSDDAPAPLGILEARPWTGHVWFRLGTGLDGRFRADGVDRPDGNATTAAKWSPSGRLWLSLYLFFFLSFLSSTPLFLGNRLYIRGREERSRQGKGMVLGPSPPQAGGAFRLALRRCSLSDDVCPICWDTARQAGRRRRGASSQQKQQGRERGVLASSSSSSNCSVMRIGDQGRRRPSRGVRVDFGW